MTSERKSLRPVGIRRSGGSGQIRSVAERKAAEMISRAESEAQIILGRGEAVAAETLPVFNKTLNSQTFSWDSRR